MKFKTTLTCAALATAATFGMAVHATTVCAGYAYQHRHCDAAPRAGDFTRWDTFAHGEQTDGYFVHRIINGREDKHVVFVLTDAPLNKGDRIEYVVVEHGYMESDPRHDSDTRLEKAAAAAAGK